ncbi:hypothetical protein HUB98_05870 [Paenibacillus barcinonensis]|uniref:Uncharacterized protein n=1 Tax=Paenibacillus barcinonensis TaxID=198119 RepID=A0A2V4WT43_PAEBA|nr:hypothetical protein [Paenibacillus barcinonensis]PYE51529.1 hypothetical protein DFQ00_102323 [Paenibacillus barcinonensis]QKS55908.1 hypothetical protein HUB98_05870 [Paenibacillus barcinonensis]
MKLNAEEMKKSIERYFANASEEQLIVDLHDTDSIKYFENPDELIVEYQEIINGRLRRSE